VNREQYEAALAKLTAEYEKSQSKRICICGEPEDTGIDGCHDFDLCEHLSSDGIHCPYHHPFYWNGRKNT
jgi:hypothetical protein